MDKQSGILLPVWLIPLILAAIAGFGSYAMNTQHLVDVERELRKDILRVEKKADKNDNMTRKLEITITRIDTNLEQINKKLEQIDRHVQMKGK